MEIFTIENVIQKFHKIAFNCNIIVIKLPSEERTVKCKKTKNFLARKKDFKVTPTRKFSFIGITESLSRYQSKTCQMDILDLCSLWKPPDMALGAI